MKFDKYEKRGAYHWKEYAGRTPYRKLAETVSSFFPERGSVLDVGCGDGLISYLLHRKGLKVTGIDNHPLAIKFARKNTKGQIEFKLLNIYKASSRLKNRRFHYLLASEVIEHLPDPSILKKLLLRHCKRYAVITTPLKRQKKGKYHYREYTPKELVEVFHPLKCKLLKVTADRIYLKVIPKKITAK
ncbi:MAG TPA: methyltransferase domain-containing protein [Firmicutes bacterium]|jgi:2-polyprenyl-3-methyl-5-hydroxy-6-metoxy-1,4-benzoquinol methylase|nr:methyltransferase domain-containing protein [Bacillota bacterium]